MKDSRTPNCPTCGYDLAGITREDGSAICPECGSCFTKSDLSPPQEPPATVMHTIFGMLLIPSVLAQLCYWSIHANNGSLGAGLLLPIVAIVGLFIYGGILVLIEHRSRKRINAAHFQFSMMNTIMMILGAYTISSILWILVLKLSVEIISAI